MKIPVKKERPRKKLVLPREGAPAKIVFVNKGRLTLRFPQLEDFIEAVELCKKAGIELFLDS